jgi:hypothetical protein
MSAQSSTKGVYLGHANHEIVIGGKLVVARNGEVSIRGLVVFGLSFQNWGCLGRCTFARDLSHVVSTSMS